MMEQEFARNSAPEYVAVMIIAAALVDEIENSAAPGQRRLVLDQLRNVEAIEKSDLLTEMIRQAEWQAHHWVETGAITEQVRAYLMSEVVGALDGQTASERHTRRLTRIVDDALVKPILERKV
jgi:hypothetical protein